MVLMEVSMGGVATSIVLLRTEAQCSHGEIRGEIHWKSKGSQWGLPWNFHGASIGAQGFYRDSIRAPTSPRKHVLPWKLPWYSRGAFMGLQSDTHGTFVVPPWDFHGSIVPRSCFHRASVVLSIRASVCFRGASMVLPWCLHDASCFHWTSIGLP